MPSNEDFLGADEEPLGTPYMKEVYPFIDPHKYWSEKTFRGKVVYITGASRGIGAETALQFARAGAAVVLVSRFQTAIDGTKRSVLDEIPEAQILAIAADVTQCDEIKKSVEAAVELFGRIDIVVANAGKAGPWDKKFLEKTPQEWWDVVEVNLRGVYNTVYCCLPYLQSTRGYVIAVTSRAAQLRIPCASDYCVSKHALDRFVELLQLEYPEVTSFALHPGSVPTEMGLGTMPPAPTDSVALPAAVMIYLTSGDAGWLSGRYVSANWDLEKVEKRYKDAVLGRGGFVSKLYIPK